MALANFGVILRNCTEPFECLWRRGRARGAAAPAVATLALDRACDNAGCLGIEADLKAYLAKFNRADNWASPAAVLRPTASAIDLDAYASFADYAAAVSKTSRGNDNRLVKKAKRKGFTARNLGVEIDCYASSILAIRRSKRMRSGGPVWDAWRAPGTPRADDVRDPVPPFCRQHWILLWGVFMPTATGERLVAYAVLSRAGNFLRTWYVMGHSEFLREGVVKLLFFDVLQWLLARQDPCVQGIRYFVYGATEHGRAGLFEWKRRMQFKPVLLARMDAPPAAG